MTTYRRVSELGDNTLVKGDHVIFDYKGRTINYEVSEGFLSAGFINNDEIFGRLGMNPREKYEFASAAYGYKVTGGAWPNANIDRFKALTRLVRAIYDKISPSSWQEIMNGLIDDG